MMRLRDKVVMVTGAGTGIGRGLAIGLSKEGARIVVNYPGARWEAEEVTARINEIGGEAISVKADVSNANDVNLLVGKAVERFGRIDVLVNNAGVALWKPFFEITEDLWDEVIDTNLKGTFLCSQRAAREMARSAGGRIINITSVAGHAALKYLAPYCASKGAITMLTKEMAIELAPYKINVNAIAPGSIEVERNLRDDPRYDETHRGFVPLGRVGKPEDIIGAVVFLASEESDYVTGQVLYVDGGLTAYVPQPDYASMVEAIAEMGKNPR